MLSLTSLSSELLILIFEKGLPSSWEEGNRADLYAKAIPCDLLVSLKLACPTPPLRTDLDTLKQLLLKSRYLETLHYQDRGQGTQFRFNASERLPSYRELILRSYDWNHDKEDVAAHLDFSQIRSLELISVPIFNFLASISPFDFAQLNNLHIEDFSAHTSPDRRVEATSGLYKLVRDNIRALRTLRITCHIAFFAIDAILTHSKTLQNLQLRDHVGFAEGDRRCPTLQIEDLMKLSRSLVVLETLELDLDVGPTVLPNFLSALCA
ncbi:hypothetical protein B0T17DRAFT_402773 [Bombardia bombarda]|uniref:Uncharacterized protein n=1 Tax=Bombardia bombarda TaxID=252184 RepID=A0AA39U6Z5_9PEZI|nr:hypothetical protein B0T17DRAFT_402773 [Bombardia bombarda]